MEKKVSLGIMLTLLLTSMLTLPFNVQTLKARVRVSEPVIFVDPPTSMVLVGETVDINISAVDITDEKSLYGWECTISFNTTVLEALQATDGPFLKSVAPAIFLSDINNTAGTIKLGAMFYMPFPPVGAVGNGVLATITFQAEAGGKTPLQFDSTLLITVISETVVPIDHTAVDGEVTVTIPEMPKVYVDPPNSTAVPGETFTVDITIANITAEESLYIWEFHISFDPDILQGVSVLEGPFLKSAGHPTWWIQNETDNIVGSIDAVDALYPPYPATGAVGSGVLATVTFQVVDVGRTTLNFSETYLVTFNGTDIVRIDHTAVDGYFSNLLLPSAVYINLYPNPVSPGQTVTLKGVLLDEFSQPLPNETVQLYARPLAGSWRYITFVTTNNYGVFMWQATIPAHTTGIFVLAVYYPGSEMYESTYNLAVLIIQ